MSSVPVPESGMPSLRVALLANCTLDLLKPSLESALAGRGLRPDFWVAGFNQYRQAILEPQSGLYGFDPQFVILYLDAQDLFTDLMESPLDFTRDQRRERVEQAASELEALLDHASQSLPRASILLNSVFLPSANSLGGLEYNSDFSVQDIAVAWNARISGLAPRYPAVYVVDIAGAAAMAGIANWSDSRLWYLARSRWSRRAVREVARRYSAAIAAHLGMMRKCLVLDLDNTLWGGIVGEDGMTGIRLGEDGPGRAYQEFQIALRSLQRQGVLLALCSKNNPEDALQVIRSHPGMRLLPEHFATMRINWEDKASNLRAIAAELNIGVDSLVFLDDNPAERAWVRESLPEVVVPEWPEDPGEFPSALMEVAADHFYRTGLTAEDLARGRQYREQHARRAAQAASGSIEDYYRGLEMRADVAPANDLTVPRIAQLTQKTNQFNLTTRRYSDQQIRELIASGCLVYSLDLDDRFGKNGIVGVLILRPETAAEWKIDVFLLSCRVMGRTAERAFLGAVCRVLRERGATRLIGEYLPTPKNAPVASLYADLGFRQMDDEVGRQVWELDLRTQEIVIPDWFTLSGAKLANTVEDYAR